MGQKHKSLSAGQMKNMNTSAHKESRIKGEPVFEKDWDFVFVATGPTTNFAIELQDHTLYKFGACNDSEMLLLTSR